MSIPRLALLGRLTVLLFAWLAGLPAALAANGEIVLGVFPYLSPREMAEQFNPLREHLARSLGAPVTLRSAPDFRAFAERTAQGEYDFSFNAPQLARLAETRDGYLPIAQTGYRIRIIAVARKDSPVASLDDLRGRSISIGARLSITHQVMRAELMKRGLVLDRDVKYHDTAYFSNVLQSVIRGYADAGATGTLLWDGAPEAERAQLKVIYRQERTVPGFIIAAHPRLGQNRVKAAREALFRFKDTPEGKAFFAQSRQVDFRPVDAATMKSLDPYTEMLRQP